jgi:hypothetical protein
MKLSRTTALAVTALFFSSFALSSCSKKGPCPAYGTQHKYKKNHHASAPTEQLKEIRG